VLGQSPVSKRMGFLSPVEGGRWVATLAGLLGDHPPTDPQGWMDYAKNLEVPTLWEAVKDEEPLTEPTAYKFPANLRRHYEQMPDFPSGLVAVGDAHCSFNPIYAQGMTTSILGADLLGQHLAAARRAGAPRVPQEFSARFQRGLAKLCDDPWALTTGEDFRYPEVQGERPFGLSAIQWYAKRFHQVSTVDPELTLVFNKIANMLAPASDLMKPRILWKVLKGPGAPRASAP
jgi:2-polyprenyl-6-methoxyphenol hydroxylase-like FAD-dependent oxidoreductase